MHGQVLDRTAREVPRRPEAVAEDGVAAMLLFVATEVMFFAGLISAFLITRAGAVVWPPPGQPRLPVGATAVNTAVLLASGVALVAAERSLAGSARSARSLRLAIALGAFFVVFQGWEWMRLIGFGLTMRSSAYGAFFYLIVGAHALHALAALIGLGYAGARLERGALGATTLRTAGIFWYFVVGVWPLLYVLVYLG
jgi:heme/copper-type cytochrome/quinol oxidase subunit 3